LSEAKFKEEAMLTRKFWLSVLVLMFAIPMMTSAQEDALELPLSVWTAGQIDPTDNSVFYSVLLTSGAEALTDVTVSAALPEGATFVKDFWKPEAAAFGGEADGVLTWTLPAVDANTAAGPFTFVVSFEGSASEEFAPPASFKANIISSAGAAENDVLDLTLAPLEANGSLELTPTGLIDFTAVEETGLWMLAPANTVSSDVTLNFARQTIDETVVLPEVAGETWWCGMVDISASADVTFAEPVILVVPLLRAATPGSIMPVFGQVEGGEWELLSAEGSLTGEYDPADVEAAAFAMVSPDATSAYVVLNGAQISTTPSRLAIGLDVNVRTVSIQPVASFNPIRNFGSDPAPWF
jgi:hypothetical protein